MEYYSEIQKKWNSVICNNMDELGGYYAKWNKSEKNKYCIVSLIFGTLKIKSESYGTRVEKRVRKGQGRESKGVQK